MTRATALARVPRVPDSFSPAASLITSPLFRLPLLPFAFLLLPSSERLPEAEVDVAALEALDGRAAAELGDDELRRVEQVAVVHAERAERRLQAEAEAHGVRPLLAEVRVAARAALAGVEEVARAVEDVAAVVEGHGLEVARDADARFEVDHGLGVAADGHGEGVDRDGLALLVAERAARREEGRRRVRVRHGAYLGAEGAEGRDDARARLLEVEAAQRGRAAREEALADRQAAVGVVNHAVAVAVGGVEDVRHAELHARREHGVAEAVDRLVAPVGEEHLVEGEVATELLEGERVVDGEEVAARRVELAVARVARERHAEAREAHRPVGPEHVGDEEASDVVEAHVLVVVAQEDGAALALRARGREFEFEVALRLGAEGEAVDGRVAGALAQLVDELAPGVEALDDAVGAAVYGRAEEARDGGVALVLQGEREGRELLLVVAA